MASFWLLLGCLGKPKIRQSRFQEGVEKKHRFSKPLFFRFWLILGAQGGQKKSHVRLFFASFSVLGANFFDRAPFWAILMDFDGLGRCFYMIFAKYLGIEISKCSSILQPRLQQKSPRFAQDSGRSRQDSEQFSAHPRAPGV